MTHEEILSMLGDYVDYLIANSSAEAPMWNIAKVRSGKPNKWNYIDGCMITACLSPVSYTHLSPRTSREGCLFMRRATMAKLYFRYGAML